MFYFVHISELILESKLGAALQLLKGKKAYEGQRWQLIVTGPETLESTV